MCTAITFKTKDFYFGRNLDLEYNYQESITITPRNYPFQFQNSIQNQEHYAIIGIATVADNYPLYYDAVNEKGLGMAGLNFPGNAFYPPIQNIKNNIAPYELIPWILCQCPTVKEALNLILNINLADIPFSKEFPQSPLHWILADCNECITIEPTIDGLKIYNNPVGILTNNPPFSYHIQNLNNYLNVTREEAKNRFSEQINLTPYSRGMGGIGLPGDLSSSSRFIRAAFTKLNSVCENNEKESVSQFFHILDSVKQQKGCVRVGDGFEKTVYSCCCNTSSGIYYYKTYENSQITAVNLHNENLCTKNLISYPLISRQQIHYIN